MSLNPFAAQGGSAATDPSPQHQFSYWACWRITELQIEKKLQGSCSPARVQNLTPLLSIPVGLCPHRPFMSTSACRAQVCLRELSTHQTVQLVTRSYILKSQIGAIRLGMSRSPHFYTVGIFHPLHTSFPFKIKSRLLGGCQAHLNLTCACLSLEFISSLSRLNRLGLPEVITLYISST